jgi:hypothetical protein
MRKKAEIVTKGIQGIFMDSYLTIIKQIGKNPPVLPQQTMHIPD